MTTPARQRRMRARTALPDPDAHPHRRILPPSAASIPIFAVECGPAIRSESRPSTGDLAVLPRAADSESVRAGLCAAGRGRGGEDPRIGLTRTHRRDRDGTGSESGSAATPC
jgi:hypothetical protein